MACKMQCTLVVFIALTGCLSALDLNGSKVYSVYPKTKTHLEIISELERNLGGVDFWVRPSILKREGKLFVQRRSQEELKKILTLSGIEHTLFLNDVQAFLEKELQRQNQAKTEFQNFHGNKRIDFTSYHRHDEIDSYLEDLKRENPDKIDLIPLDPSFEGRTIKCVRIFSKATGRDRKPIVLIEAGLNAREWIAPSMALYVIHKLMEDITVRDLVDEIDWYIIPLLNPDGYEYTHQNSSNRLWRKTRSVTANSTCRGVNANRNFEYKWMELGSSHDPCSDIYAGVKARSEPEVSLLTFLLRVGGPKIQVYLSLHGHGSYLLYPFSDGTVPVNRDNHQKLGEEFVAAVNKNIAPGSEEYLAANAYEMLGYMSTGNSRDFALGIAGVNVSFTLNLPSGGDQGLDVQPSKIREVVNDVWEGIVALGRHTIRNHKIHND